METQKNTFWIQISSGTGPEECCLAVKIIADKLLKEQHYNCVVLDKTLSRTNNYKSVWLRVVGNQNQFQEEWEGTIKMIFKSPFRPNHLRKNWFVDVKMFAVPVKTTWNYKELLIKTARSSGAGGQHVNKVETAVSITHLPTNITVQASEERSQIMNKRLAFSRLSKAINNLNEQQFSEMEQDKWMQHRQLLRGNPVQVFLISKP